MIQFPFTQNFSALSILNAIVMLSVLDLIIQLIDAIDNKDEKFPILQ